VGGFLGMGEHEVAIDWNDLTIAENGTLIQTSITKAQLEALPEYSYQNPDYRESAFVDRTYLAQREPLSPAPAQNQAMQDKAKQAKPMDQASEPMDTTWLAADVLSASKLIGAEVVNEKNETLGEVSDLVIADNRTELVLSIGEFLGIGGTEVTLPLDRAKVYRRDSTFEELIVSVAMSKEQLTGLPKYDPET
jgi:hypothetical protein